MNSVFRYSIYTAIVVGAIIAMVPTYGYPDGAPNVICQNMTPEHPPTTTVGAAPFIIKVNSNSYKPGVKVKGMITSPTKTMFKGFLLEARAMNSDDSFGKFIVIDREQKTVHTVCGSMNDAGLTHSNNTEKTEVMFEWEPPATPVGDLRFKLTVVESVKPESRYWLDIYSQTLSASTIY